MKLYLVQNGQGLTMAIFKNKEKANACIKRVGGFLWEEKWTIEEHTLDQPEEWVMAGNESYRAAKARLKPKKAK